MFGMPPALNHQTSRNSEKTCGWATHTYQTLPRESPSSGPSSAPAPLFNTNSAKPANNTNTYSTAPSTSRISRLPGCCFFFFLCASPRCTYLLRMRPPHITAAFANNHDFAVAACLCRLLEVDELRAPSSVTAQSINQSNLHARRQPIWAQVIGEKPTSYVA